jgi:hypothetical protein
MIYGVTKPFLQTKFEFHMALEIILRLDAAQRSRDLSNEEIDLRARLRRRVVGLGALERERERG